MVKNITSFTGNGLKDWLWQRVSALMLALYFLCLGGIIYQNPGMDYSTWSTIFHGMGFKLFTLFALLAFVAHAWIGLWTVSTDYLKCVYARVGFQVSLIIFLLVLIAWGIDIIWSV